MNSGEGGEAQKVNFAAFKKDLSTSLLSIDPSFPALEHQHEYFARFGSLAAIASEKDGLALRLEGSTLNTTSISLLEAKRGMKDASGNTIADRIVAAVVESARRAHIKHVCAFGVDDSAIPFWVRNGFIKGCSDFDKKRKNYYFVKK